MQLFNISVYPRLNYIDSLNFWFGNVPEPNLIFNAIGNIQYSKLTNEATNSLINIFSENYLFNASLSIDLLGGKMKIMDDSAFPHRNAFCIYQFIVLAEKEKEEESKKWLRLVYDIMKPYTCGCYVGFCNNYIKSKDYFLQNSNRIKRGFRKYDPCNMLYKAYYRD